MPKAPARSSLFHNAVLLTLGSFFSPLQATEPLPNILFIIADDLGVMDVGIETPDEDFYETPHLDQLAQRSMRFDQGYSSSPVCSPARASIFLGTDPARHGITDWIGAQVGVLQAERRRRSIMPPEYVRALPHEATTLAEAFRDAGYETFFSGKWHLGPEGSWPEDHGFNTNIGGWNSGSPRGGYFAPWDNPRLPSGPDGESLTHRLARETAAFIQSEQEKPFFAFLSFYNVHSPAQTSEERWSKYRDKAEQLGWKGDRFAIDRTLPVRLVRDNPIYGGMVETMDEAIGIVLAALEAAGLADNTIVVFTSDHGGVVSGDHNATSMLPMRGGKGRQWEGGLRVPLYIYVPGVTQPGSRTNVPMTGSDFFPTLLDLAGLPLMPGQHIDGVSLAPVLRGEEIEPRDLFWHYPHYSNQGGDPSSIIRRGDWKLIYYYEDQRHELYNLAEDPHELTDVAAENKATVAELSAALNAYLVRTGANLPKPWPGYHPDMAEERRAQALSIKAQWEAEQAEFLDPNWQPNPTWWDSALGPD
jgi:arylsulfatase A-like enzyme